MARSEVVPVSLPNGALVHAEVTLLGGAEEEVAFGGALSMDRLAGSIEGIARAVRDAVAHVAPNKVTVEFGLEMAIDGGALVALLVNGSTKAALKVTLEWAEQTQKT